MLLSKLASKFGWVFTLAHCWMLVFLTFGMMFVVIANVISTDVNLDFSGLSLVICSFEATALTSVLVVQSFRKTSLGVDNSNEQQIIGTSQNKRKIDTTEV